MNAIGKPRSTTTETTEPRKLEDKEKVRSYEEVITQ